MLPKTFREAIPEENLLRFGHCPKGGGGSNPNPNYSRHFCLLGFGHFLRGGVDPNPKLLRHFFFKNLGPLNIFFRFGHILRWGGGVDSSPKLLRHFCA